MAIVVLVCVDVLVVGITALVTIPVARGPAPFQKPGGTPTVRADDPIAAIGGYRNSLRGRSPEPGVRCAALPIREFALWLGPGPGRHRGRQKGSPARRDERSRS